MQSAARSTTAVVLLLFLTPMCQAQWTVIDLHATAFGLSEGTGAFGNQVVGNTYIDGSPRGLLWSGTAESWVDLTPPGSLGSGVYGVSDGVLVGHAYIPRRLGVAAEVHAGLWTGNGESFVDLNPESSFHSMSIAVGDGQQVGEVVVNGLPHASLWEGTATSWVDLTPVGYPAARAYGVSGGVQVGEVANMASLWTGTAESWVDLSPEDSVGSVASGVHDGQQVGTVRFASDEGNHASLWNGSAASWVDLNPPGSIESHANGVFRGQQVGDAYVDGELRAVLWTNSAESWVDLNEFLPPEFDYAVATAIWSDESAIRISGLGGSRQTGVQHALLWTRAIPEPNSLSLLAIAAVAGLAWRRCNSRNRNVSL
jgi:hypothetical protein